MKKQNRKKATALARKVNDNHDEKVFERKNTEGFRT